MVGPASRAHCLQTLHQTFERLLRLSTPGNIRFIVHGTVSPVVPIAVLRSERLLALTRKRMIFLG
jgi:hypothetical protein